MSTTALASLARRAVGLGPLHITKRQKYGALLVAALIDAAQLALPLATLLPAEWIVDVVAAGVLTLILGWNWRLLVAFAIEAIPGVGIFPTWTAMLMTLLAVSTVSEDAPKQALPTAGAGPVPPAPGGQIPLPTTPVTGDPAARFPGSYHQRSRLSP